MAAIICENPVWFYSSCSEDNRHVRGGGQNRVLDGEDTLMPREPVAATDLGHRSPLGGPAVNVAANELMLPIGPKIVAANRDPVVGFRPIRDSNHVRDVGTFLRTRAWRA